MLSNAEVRRVWGKACSGSRARVMLHGGGAVVVATSLVPAVKALSGVLARHNYNTRAEDTGGYNCRKITGGSAWSLHAYAISVDLNWRTNPYGRKLITDMPRAMVDEILAIRTVNGKQVWRWGGDFSGNKDAMHFECCCSPADLATGIAGTAPRVMPTRSTIKVGDQGHLVGIAMFEISVISGARYPAVEETQRIYWGGLLDAVRNLGTITGRSWDGKTVGPEQWEVIDFLFILKGHQPLT